MKPLTSQAAILEALNLDGMQLHCVYDEITSRASWWLYQRDRFYRHCAAQVCNRLEATDKIALVERRPSLGKVRETWRKA